MAELEQLVDECIKVACHIENNDDALEWLELLEEKRNLRDLSRISINIQEGIKTKSSYEIVKNIDKSLGKLFMSSSNNKGFNSSKKAIETLTNRPLLGITTGMETFDRLTGGLVRGGILSVGGISGNLKTTNAYALLRSILITNQGMKGAILEIDMDSRKTVSMILGQLGINRTSLIKGEISMQDITEILESDPLKDRLMFYTGDQDRINNFEAIQKIVLREHPDIWVVDYMGRLVMSESQSKGRDYGKHNLYFGETMMLLNILAQRTNSIGIVIHQNDMKSIRFRKDPRPQLGDIEWSSDLVRYSDYIYFCYYPVKYRRFPDDLAKRIFIQMWEKSRTSDNTFTILEFDPPTGRMTEPSPVIRQMGNNHWYNLERELYPRQSL
jgi:replicative DNA helicase